MPSRPAPLEGEDSGQELQAIHADLASLVQRRLRMRMLEVRCGGRSRVCTAVRAPSLTCCANPGWSRTTTWRRTASRTRQRPTHASSSVRSPCKSFAGWAPVPVQHAREQVPFKYIRLCRSPRRPQPRHGTRYASRANPLHVSLHRRVRSAHPPPHVPCALASCPVLFSHAGHHQKHIPGCTLAANHGRPSRQSRSTHEVSVARLAALAALAAPRRPPPPWDVTQGTERRAGPAMAGRYDQSRHQPTT